MLETPDEELAVNAFLRRRFSKQFAMLGECLDAADPLDVAYPDNPGEYNDVVREVLVLLASVNADLSKVTVERLEEAIREGLLRRFGEYPDDERLKAAVRLIRQRTVV